MGLHLDFQESEAELSALANERANPGAPSDSGRLDSVNYDGSFSKRVFTPDHDGADDSSPFNLPDHSTGGRGAATAFSENSNERRPLHDEEHEESQAYSYGEYIRAEAPRHYQKYYLQYDECKALIGHLAYVNALSKQSPSAAMLRSLSTQSVPVKVRILLKQALQSLQSHVRVENPYLYTLALQIAFRDRLSQEIEKINRFVAAQYHTIEQTLRGTYRHIVQLVALDKSHHVVKEEPSENASLTRIRSEAGCFGPTGKKGKNAASQGQLAMAETRNDADGLGAISSPSGCSSSFSDFDTESCSDDADDDSSFPSAGAFDTERGRCHGVDASSRRFAVWRFRQLRRLKRALGCQASEITHLDMFIRLNYKGILRLTSIFDNATASAISPWITASLKRELFANVDVDKLLVFMSLAWAKWRSAESREYLTETDDAEKKWIPPESFVRNTTKYWVPLDQVIPLKLAILRHMPYLIFGHSAAELESFIDPFSVLVDPPAVAAHDVTERAVPASGGSESRFTSQSAHPNDLPATMSMINDDERGSDSSSPIELSPPARIEEGQLVTSIYFDALDGYSYGRRIRRVEGAELVRFRWYGSNHGESNKPIFVERKTHHIRVQTGLSSTKERFSIEQKRVLEYMQGRFDMNAYVEDLAAASHKPVSDKKFQHMLALGNAVQQLLVTRRMRPMIRTSYQRSAFQLATSNEVRFSLDTNLCMVDEFTRDSPDNDNPHDLQRPWCRLGEEILGKVSLVKHS